MSPERVPGGSSISCPHPLHCTTTILTPQEPCPLDLLAQPEQPLDLAAIEADHHLIINDGDRGRPVAEPQQLIKSRLVFLDVLVCKGNPLLRKKLFLLVACPSARLTVDDDLSCHQRPPVSFASSGLRRANPNSSNPAKRAKSGKRT